MQITADDDGSHRKIVVIDRTRGAADGNPVPVQVIGNIARHTHLRRLDVPHMHALGYAYPAG